jgi:DNA helicase-2/ATP-dependent DNA helicase PcrA
MFVWNSEDINSEQESAILERENVLLIACPGSGKTRTLTYKVAYELSKLRSKKKYIIAITYTHRAADEIKERIENMGVDTSQLWIGTIHAFCSEWILKPYQSYEEDLKCGYRVINSHDTEELLFQLCAPYSDKRISPYDCTYIIKSDGYLLSCKDANKHTYVDDILQEYWRILNENRQIDFQMMLYYSYKLLTENRFISKVLSKVFSYILLDEYQDTSEIQYLILSEIIKSSGQTLRAFIVGDPNQAIYTNLGGYAIKLGELERLTESKFHEFNLSSNYRSSEIIINYFDHYKTYANSIVSMGKNKAYQSDISYNKNVDRELLVEEIVRLILYNIETKGVSQNEICIIAPQWVHLASLTRNLMIKLPDYSFDGPGMAPFSRDIDNFFYKLIRIVLTEPSPSLYVSRLRWSSEILKELDLLNIDISRLSPKIFLKKCNEIEINEGEGLPFLKKFIDELFDALKIDINSYEHLKEHYASFFKSSQDRIAKLVKEGFVYISTTDNFRKMFKQRHGITVSTIHGVKGAEFDAVIAFALLEDYVPHFSDQNKADSANKLLYVICSRAKKNLHLISERGRLKNFGNPRPEYTPTTQLLLHSFIYSKC